MNSGLKITLRAGERIFVNGGVLKVDRKVSIELMNDVIFLLEQHVMKPVEPHQILQMASELTRNHQTP